MKLFFRVFLLALPRFIILMVILIGLNQIDFSPLPAWTMLVIAYLAHFVVTYFFANWAFHKHRPNMKQALLVGGTFIIWGSMLEALLFIVLQGGRTNHLWDNYHWQSLYIVALYILAVAFSAYHMRRHYVKTELAEGLES